MMPIKTVMAEARSSPFPANPETGPGQADKARIQVAARRRKAWNEAGGHPRGEGATRTFLTRLLRSAWLLHQVTWEGGK